MKFDATSEKEMDEREVEWDNEPISATPEGPRTPDERAYQRLDQGSTEVTKGEIDWEPEPALEARQ